MVTHNIQARQGDDLELIVRWLDSEMEAVPIASARMQVRPSVRSNASIISVTTDDDELTLTDDHEVTIRLRPEEDRSGVWDLEATSVTGRIKTLVGGKFIVFRDVTR